MCGISGFFGSFSPDDLERMNAIQTHRGPDDAGVYTDDWVGLAHRRLSIIDLEGGHQPMSNEDGTVWIVFNGEIYNFEEIRRKHLRGHRFATRCDTEVIVHLYEEFGERCVEYLRGMFAFAIWDRNRKTLLLARDRFGIKPLYVTRTGRGLAFASEIKGLLELQDVPRAVNLHALDSYSTFRYVPGNETMFTGIEKVEPGHTLLVDERNERYRQYWDLRFGGAGPRNGQEAAVELRRQLEKAIELRLISEVPLGAFLSGGLDSSFIVGLMAGLKDEPVETFTVSLGGKWHDESEFAGVVADAFRTRHHVLKVRADAAPTLPSVVWHLDEPMADAATIPTYLMSELTRKYVTVVLSGEGADELMAGYAKYKAVRYGRLASNPLVRLAARAVGRWPGLGVTSRRLVEFFEHRDFAEAYVGLASVFSEEEKDRLYGPVLRSSRNRGEVVNRVRSVLDQAGETAHVLDRLAYLDIKTWLPNDVLLKNDKMSMAHGLEARVPFLDHEFAEFAVSIPPGLKLRGAREKQVLRDAMEGLVPGEICRRRKHGFTVPVADWMARELRPLVSRLLCPDRLEERGYWNPSYVGELIRRDLSNEYYRRQLWTVLTFEIWHETFLEEGRPPRP